MNDKIFIIYYYNIKIVYAIRRRLGSCTFLRTDKTTHTI